MNVYKGGIKSQPRFRERVGIPRPNARRAPSSDSNSSNNTNTQMQRRMARARPGSNYYVPPNRTRSDDLPPEPRPNWINAIAETDIVKKNPNNENLENIATGDPMKKGIKLKCGHYVSKATLRGMVKSGRTLTCPYCREPIKKENLV